MTQAEIDRAVSLATGEPVCTVSGLGFSIADETRELIREIGDSGELETLVAERVWSELSRALDENDPSVFFTSLRDKSGKIISQQISGPKFTSFRLKTINSFPGT